MDCHFLSFSLIHEPREKNCWYQRCRCNMERKTGWKQREDIGEAAAGHIDLWNICYFLREGAAIYVFHKNVTDKGDKIKGTAELRISWGTKKRNCSIFRLGDNHSASNSSKNGWIPPSKSVIHAWIKNIVKFLAINKIEIAIFMSHIDSRFIL